MPLNKSPAAETNTMGATAAVRVVLSMECYRSSVQGVVSVRAPRFAMECQSAALALSVGVPMLCALLPRMGCPSDLCWDRDPTTHPARVDGTDHPYVMTRRGVHLWDHVSCGSCCVWAY